MADGGWLTCAGPAEDAHAASAQWNEGPWVGRKMTASSDTGGLCSVQTCGASSVGGNAGANGVYSVETSETHGSCLSVH